MAELGSHRKGESSPLPKANASEFYPNLVDVGKRYRVDVEKAENAVASEFAAKRAKQPKSKTKAKPMSAACRQSSDAGVERISFLF